MQPIPANPNPNPTLPATLPAALIETNVQLQAGVDPVLYTQIHEQCQRAYEQKDRLLAEQALARASDAQHVQAIAESRAVLAEILLVNEDRLRAQQECDLAYALYQQVPSDLWDAVALCQLHMTQGAIHYFKMEFERSMYCCKQAYALAQSTNYESGIQRSLCYQARTCWQMGLEKHAIEYLSEVLSRHQVIDQTLGFAYETLAAICMNQQQYALACEYYQQFNNLQCRRKNIDLHVLADSYCELAFSQIYNDELDAAYIALEQAFALFAKDARETRFVGYAYNVRALWHLEHGDLLTAQHECEHALAIQRRQKSIPNEIGCLELLGRIYTKQGAYARAEEALQLALEYTEAHEFTALSNQVYGSLVELYRDQEKWARAFVMLEQQYAFQRKQAVTAEITLRALLQLEQKQRHAAAIQQKNSELVALNQQLAALHQEKDEILELVAHDLKNPLGVLRLSIDVLSQDHWAMGTDEITMYLASSQTIIAKMGDLIAQLLKFRELESGDTALTIEAQELPLVVEREVQRYQLMVQAKQQQIVVECAEQSLAAVVDLRAVEQVLNNLISNASKYALQNTTITIRLYRDTDHWPCIAVQDQGQGFSIEEKQKLFQKFVRLSSRPTGGESATGVGLYMVRKLVLEMGGDIWAESDGKGCGATFVVKLPPPVVAQERIHSTTL